MRGIDEKRPEQVTVAVDPATSSILVNSADGRLYRWHLPSNQLTQNLRFNNGYLESYTPTAIGPDGKVYAINIVLVGTMRVAVSKQKTPAASAERQRMSHKAA